MARRDEELPIIHEYYEFLVWFTPKVGKFPREQRFTLGERVELVLYRALELLIRARYAQEKIPLLDQLNVELEVLRFQLRLAKDLNCLPLKAYGDASQKLLSIGKQLGGWRKQQERKSRP
ncbi:MAG: diversity-generating retroelement protein Avd [Planctomycetaceae bacterium]